MAVLRDTAGVIIRDTAGLPIYDTAGEEAPTTRVAPTAIVASTNLTGAVGDIDEDPDSPDASWLGVTVGNAGIDLLVRFVNPGEVTGAQNFQTQLRKTAGAANQIIDVELWQHDGSGDLALLASWAFVATLSDDLVVSSASGQIDQHNWTAAQLASPTRAVACRIVGGGL